MSEWHQDSYTAAAAWHTRLADEDDSPQAHGQFGEWLAADPKHAAAFAAVERAWLAMAEGRIDARILKLRREALSATRRPRLLRVAAAAVLLVALAALVFGSFRKAPLAGNGLALTGADSAASGAFRTAVGERSMVALADGSSVALNTNSRIQVHFTPAQRSVRLLSGQAWFQVARDAGRPFIVEAGDQRVTALGTAFDVRLDERDAVQVTLAEGRVSVEPIRSAIAALIRPAAVAAELSPGEALTVSADAPARKRKADLAKVAGWRQGQVVFDNDTLAAAIEEVNRYSPTRIVLADAALGDLRVSGVFRAGYSESFVETVTGHFPIRIVSRDESRIVLAPAQ